MLGAAPHFSVLNNYQNSDAGCASHVLNLLSFPARAVLGGVKVDVITGKRNKECSLVAKIIIAVFCILIAPLAAVAVVSLLVKAALVSCSNRKVTVETLMVKSSNERKVRSLARIFNSDVLMQLNAGVFQVDKGTFVNRVLRDHKYVDVFANPHKVVAFLGWLDENVKKDPRVGSLVWRVVADDIEKQCEFKIHEHHGNRVYECKRDQPSVCDVSSAAGSRLHIAASSQSYKTTDSLEVCKQRSLREFVSDSLLWGRYSKALGLATGS